MKITYLSSSFIPSRSANSVHVMKMCNAFTENGQEVELHALKGDKSDKDDFAFYGVNDNFKIVKHNETASFTAGALLFMRSKVPFMKVGAIPSVIYGFSKHKKFLLNNPDLIYSRNLFWLYGVLAASKTDTRFILESHRPPADKIEQHLQNKLFKRDNFKGLVVISERLKDIYMEIFPVLTSSQIFVAHDAADAIEDAEYIKPALAPSAEGRLLIGYTGHLYKGRGIENIIEMAFNIPNADFHIIGGTEEDIRRCKEEHTPDNITFHGFIPHGELNKYMASFDVLLAPYQAQVAVSGNSGDTAAFMSPLKLFEYMSWGKAILCSDLPVLHEIFRHDKNALLLPPDDIKSWVKAIKSLQASEGLRNRLGEAARQEFLKKHTWQERARKILGYL